MYEPVYPEVLIVHIISFEVATLKCADLHFGSTSGHAFVFWGPAGPPRAFLVDLFYTNLVCNINFSLFSFSCFFLLISCHPRNSEPRKMCV